jgi:hypothetical protein
MSEFKGNSDERTIELYQERIDGFNHEYKYYNSDWELKLDNNEFFLGTEYRKAKPTRIINGITVPMCMTEKPKDGSTYYIAVVSRFDKVFESWRDDTFDNHYLNSGLAFFTLEDALETRNAILAGTKI